MTTSSPESSKYTDVARALENDLARSPWSGDKLPSVRKIASTYGVSVVTASRAMQVLRDKGMIRTVERGGCFRETPPDSERWAIILRLTPGPMIGLTTSLVRDGFESLARRSPMHLHFDSFHLSRGLTEKEATNAAKLAKANGINGVVMLPSRSGQDEIVTDGVFVDGCRSAGLPIVLYERSLAEPNQAKCDVVCMDDIASTRAAVDHLIASGRKNLVCVTASAVSSHRHRVAGFLLALQLSEHKYKYAVLNQDSELTTTTAGAYTSLAAKIVKLKSDAVVCYSDYAAQGIMIELQKLGLKIPDDVAIVGCDNLLFGDQFSTPLTTLSYEAAEMAEHAINCLRRRIKKPDALPVTIAVPSQLIVRSST